MLINGPSYVSSFPAPASSGRVGLKSLVEMVEFTDRHALSFGFFLHIKCAVGQHLDEPIAGLQQAMRQIWILAYDFSKTAGVIVLLTARNRPNGRTVTFEDVAGCAQELL